jgi:predicted esterase
MTKVEEIKVAIEALPKEEYVQLRRWFTERDWHEWDRQIEVDSAAGKLDYLIEEAFEEKKMGRLKEL